MTRKHYIYLCTLFLFLISCKTSQTDTFITDLDYVKYDVEPDFAQDAEIESFIAPYREQLSERMDEVIAWNEQAMPKRKPNSLLGNWFADVLHTAAEDLTKKPVDFALQNHGGLRVPALSEGEVTVGSIFELMPFDNILIVIEADGEATRKLLNRVADYGGWPTSRGLSFTINSKDRIAENIMIQGEAFDDNKHYSIALPDYIANGGDDCDFLAELKRNNTGVFIRDAVIQQLKKNDPDSPLKVDATKRIIVE